MLVPRSLKYTSHIVHNIALTMSVLSTIDIDDDDVDGYCAGSYDNVKIVKVAVTATWRGGVAINQI